MAERFGFGARLGLMGVSILVLLGVLEGGIRIAAPEPLSTVDSIRRGAFQQPGDHVVHTEGQKATVHVNADGFADREWGPKERDKKRVVLIGDSFVQAAQVDAGKGIGSQLDELLGPDVEVLSMGVPGAGTGTAWMLLKEEALPREPDLVVLGFLVSNDVLNNHPLLDNKADKPYFRIGPGGGLVPWSPADASLGKTPDGLLWQHSHLVRAVGRATARSAEARARVERGDGMPIELRVHEPDRNPVWEEAWRITEALVQQMAEDSVASGAAFGVLLFPDPVQATKRGYETTVRRWPPLKDWDVQAATRRAETVLSAHAPVQDLTPALQAAEVTDDAPLYFSADGHWTARGHRVAAEAAAPAVAKWLGLTQAPAEVSTADLPAGEATRP